MTTIRNVPCPDCHEPMNFLFSPSLQFHVYRCVRFPSCRGMHRARSDGTPLGIPGDRETRESRCLVHRLLDQVQSLLRMEKPDLYEYMADLMGLPAKQAHVSKLTNSQCQMLIRLLYERHGHELDGQP